MDNFNLKKYLVENKLTTQSRLNENEDKVKTILSKIGDIEEKIYDQYSDDEIEAKFDYSKAIDDIKTKYKDDKDKMYDALVSHLKKLKSSFQSRLNEEVDNNVDVLYNKIIDYMDNNYSSNDIVEDDIYTILNDVLKVEYTPETFRQILKKIKTESEYSFED